MQLNNQNLPLLANYRLSILALVCIIMYMHCDYTLSGGMIVTLLCEFQSYSWSAKVYGKNQQQTVYDGLIVIINSWHNI